MRGISSQVPLIGALMALVDLVAVGIGFLIAFGLRAYLGRQGIIFEPLAHGIDIYLNYWPIALLWPFVLWREGVYPGLWMTADEELQRTVEGATLAGLIVILLTFVTRTGREFSRPILAGWWLISLILLPVHHMGVKLLSSTFKLGGVPSVILGANGLTVRILKGLQKRDIPPVKPMAIFSTDAEAEGGADLGLSIVGSLDQAAAWAQENGVATALIILPEASNSEIVDLTEQLSKTFRRILVIPDLFGLSTVGTDVRDLDGTLALEVRQNLLSWQSQLVKRVLDTVLSIAVTLLSLPLWVVIPAALWLEREGPVLYAHERVGRGGKKFTAWKFRTMVSNADDVLGAALTSDPVLRQEWEESQKLKEDPRLTTIGTLLRRLSLDELPQLWNILRQEMSLVGPRPIIPEEISRYGQAYELYVQVRPGLTGLWQVSGRSNLSYEERVRLDSYYVRNWSVWLDLVILLRTFLAVVTGRGAY